MLARAARTALTALLFAGAAQTAAAAPGMVEYYRYDCAQNLSALSGNAGWIKRYAADDWSSGVNGTSCAPKTSDPTPVSWNTASPATNFLRQSAQRPLGDFDLHVDLQLNELRPAGLVFGWEDDQNYWVVFIVAHGGGGQYPLPDGSASSTSNGNGGNGLYLYRVTNGVAQAQGAQGLWQSPVLSSTYTLSVLRRQNNLRILIDGTQVNERPTTVAAGDFGFWAWDTDQPRFDYIAIEGFDADGDGVPPEAGDCDDDAADVAPGAPEVCDGIDNDCDGVIDGAGATDGTTWYRDADNDGFGVATDSVIACSQPTGYVAASGDCNDGSNATYPGAPEACNGVDNDCNGVADAPAPTSAPVWYDDDDGDGYGAANTAINACSQPTGYVNRAGDCDDGRSGVNPGAAEVCDGRDTNCDGTIDSPVPSNATTWYRDVDGDGFGDLSDALKVCSQPAGYVASSTDCDDDRANVRPGAPEVCDGVDNDCDGTVDGPTATDLVTWYADNDGDGFGSPSNTRTQCEQPNDYVANNQDCNDNEPLAYTGATERCDNVDNDCNGVVDGPNSVDAALWYLDADNDTYGNPAQPLRACTQPTGYVANNDDCNDSDRRAYDNADEVCDNVDNDCDGTVDGPNSVDARTWYVDADGDTYGDPASGVRSCAPIAGRVNNGGDCDDNDDEAWTNAIEQCDNRDNNCNGEIDEDVVFQSFWRDNDGDGFGDPNVVEEDCVRSPGYVANNLDCNDQEPRAWEGALEVCGDGADNNCDGFADDDSAIDALTWFADLDGDGYGDVNVSVVACDAPPDTSPVPGDCNDAEPLAWFGAAEVCDGVDNDCDGAIDGPEAVDATLLWTDADGDGYGDALSSPMFDCLTDATADNDLDCDDSESAIFPGATDIPGNGVDEDCDGFDAEEEEPVDTDDTDEPTGDGGTRLPSTDGVGGAAIAGSGCGCAAAGGTFTPWAFGLLMLVAGLRRARR